MTLTVISVKDRTDVAMTKDPIATLKCDRTADAEVDKGQEIHLLPEGPRCLTPLVMPWP